MMKVPIISKVICVCAGMHDYTHYSHESDCKL